MGKGWLKGEGGSMVKAHLYGIFNILIKYLFINNLKI